MAEKYQLTTSPTEFTVTRESDGAFITIGRGTGDKTFNPLETWVAGIVACSASTSVSMVEEEHGVADADMDWKYYYTRTLNPEREVDTIKVAVNKVEGHDDIDVAEIADRAEATRCTVSHCLRKPPTVAFKQPR